jgi:hypothetical protein
MPKVFVFLFILPQTADALDSYGGERLQVQTVFPALRAALLIFDSTNASQ